MVRKLAVMPTAQDARQPKALDGPRDGTRLAMKSAAKSLFVFARWCCAVVALLLLLEARPVTGQAISRAVLPGGEFIQQAVPARQTSCDLCPGDQLWVINTRDFASCKACGELRVGQYAGNCYQLSSLAALGEEIAANPDLPTMVYVHGNFTDLGWSLQRGCEVYGKLFRECPCRAPVRFIIWSWKTEREAGPVCDFDIKLARSVEEGERLWTVLNQLPLQQPSVVGYSLGCQVILSALTQPAGGVATPWNVVLMAPALECHFAPRLCDRPLTEDSVAELTVLTNSRDRALKYSRLRCLALDCHGEPLDQYSVLPLLGGGGLAPCVIEISREVGGRHAISRYYSSPTMNRTIRGAVLGPRSAGPAADVATQ